ncbi:MAG: hypothetical protein KA914_07165 [Ottowia sp.]|nr:hypothetical protein [Ottowia sp.]
MSYCLPTRVRARAAWLLCAAAALMSPAAHAIDWSTGDWGGYSPDGLNDLAQSQMSYRAVKQMQELTWGRGKGGGGKAAPKRSVLDASNVFVSGDRFNDVRGIEQLAAQDGSMAGDYFRRKGFYHKMIWNFDQNVQRLYGVPPSNLATGMTALLAGGYAAYYGKTFPDAWVKPLYRQAEKLMTDNPRVQSARLRDKPVMYQLMVGVGMELQLVQLELQKNPNPAMQRRLREAGAQVLRTVFDAEPDQVQFSSSGLRVK